MVFKFLSNIVTDLLHFLLVQISHYTFKIILQRWLSNPFKLFFRVVRHSDIDKQDYYTISKQGVSHISKLDNEFTPLSRWEKELRDYGRLIKIKTFFNFRMWKAFYVWKKNVHAKYEFIHSLSFIYIHYGFAINFSPDMSCFECECDLKYGFVMNFSSNMSCFECKCDLVPRLLDKMSRDNELASLTFGSIFCYFILSHLQCFYF